MNNNSTQIQCNSCGTVVQTYDGVYLSDERTNHFLCSRNKKGSNKKGSSLPLTLINFEQGSTVDLTTFFRIEFDSTLIQKVESLFLLIPQIATHFIAKKFSLKSIVMIDDGMNVGTALFTVDEILSENWELVF